MANERTPLIQVVHTAPPRRRYPHQTCRRFFTIASSAILIYAFASFAFHAFFIWPLEHRHGKHGHYTARRKGLSPEDVQSILFDTPSPEQAEEWSRYYTSGVHLAGTNYSQVTSPSRCIEPGTELSSRPSGPRTVGKSGV